MIIWVQRKTQHCSFCQSIPHILKGTQVTQVVNSRRCRSGGVRSSRRLLRIRLRHTRVGRSLQQASDTPGQYCLPTAAVASSRGPNLLIHTFRGRAGGVRTPRTNRSGVAAKALRRTASRSVNIARRGRDTRPWGSASPGRCGDAACCTTGRNLAGSSGHSGGS